MLRVCILAIEGTPNHQRFVFSLVRHFPDFNICLDLGMPGCDIGHCDPSTGDAYSTEAPYPTSIFLRGPFCSALNLFVAIRIFETVDNLLLSILYTCIHVLSKGEKVTEYTCIMCGRRLFL